MAAPRILIAANETIAGKLATMLGDAYAIATIPPGRALRALQPGLNVTLLVLEAARAPNFSPDRLRLLRYSAIGNLARLRVLAIVPKIEHGPWKNAGAVVLAPNFSAHELRAALAKALDPLIAWVEHPSYFGPDRRQSRGLTLPHVNGQRRNDPFRRTPHASGAGDLTGPLSTNLRRLQHASLSLMGADLPQLSDFIAQVTALSQRATKAGEHETAIKLDEVRRRVARAPDEPSVLNTVDDLMSEALFALSAAHG